MDFWFTPFPSADFNVLRAQDILCPKIFVKKLIFRYFEISVVKITKNVKIGCLENRLKIGQNYPKMAKIQKKKKISVWALPMGRFRFPRSSRLLSLTFHVPIIFVCIFRNVDAQKREMQNQHLLESMLELAKINQKLLILVKKSISGSRPSRGPISMSSELRTSYTQRIWWKN